MKNTPIRKAWRLATEAIISNFAQVAIESLHKGHPLEIQIKDAKKTVDQNAMMFALFSQVGAQSVDCSITDIRKQCKLDLGVPILCAYDPGYASAWAEIERGLTYEQRLDIMRFYPVTSLFNKKQGSEFIDEVIRTYSAQGFSLVHPSEL